MIKKNKYCLLAAICFFACTFFANANPPSKWHRGIVRVNTDVSAGRETFSEVAIQAETAGLEFIIFSDQFLVIAEYGFPPFRHSTKVFKARKSIVSYGIEEYLKQIEATDKEFPNLIIIPGADIAPHYFWRGTPFSKSFSCDQFSEQITVFGPKKTEFYKNLPVIHNEQTGFSFMSIVKLLPLLLAVWGILLFWFRGADIDHYTLSSEEKSHKNKTKMLRAIISVFLIILGILWTIHNRPFTEKLPFDQYADYDNFPYQNVIDYIRKNSDQETCGVFWSAPEATMVDEILGVKLLTQPYLDDILATKGHNGFAGIYGDALTAQKPGKEWDQLLEEYCNGIREFKPVIIGEIDYHGKKRAIDMVQTVVQVQEFNYENIIKAICNGNSYAYGTDFKENRVEIENISLSQGKNSATLGNTLQLSSSTTPILNIKGYIKSFAKEKSKIHLTLVGNGKKILTKQLHTDKFDLKIPLKQIMKEPDGKGYVRFMMETDNAGKIFSNPIFFEKQKKSEK